MMRIVGLLVFCLSAWVQAETFQDSGAFLEAVFKQDLPKPQLLWLKKDRRAVAEQILGHKALGMRVRYWQQQGRCVWILEEVGKELPITVGVVISGQQIEQVKVLAFRESRGWEVKHDFFTQQFKGAGLDAGHGLDRAIDGISGATLSVRALKKIARLALYYQQQVLSLAEVKG